MSKPRCRCGTLFAPPRPSISDEAEAWEQRIRDDFQAHPGSWRPDPENWVREGWLAGFRAGRGEEA